MTTQIVLFINFNNKEENIYGDCIRPNLLKDNDVLVEWSGQKKSKKYDEDVKNEDMVTHIYYRVKNSERFRYIGVVKERKVIDERTDDKPLRMWFKMETEGNLLEYNTPVDNLMKTVGKDEQKEQRDFKTPCFEILGLEVPKDLVSGISKVKKI